MEEILSPSFDFRQLIAPESLDLIIQNFREHAVGREVPSGQYGLVTKAGVRLDSIITTRVIQYNHESSILGIVTDITQQKNVEKELLARNLDLVAAKEKAEESDKLKSAFLANISHEIRTPLNGILGFSELLDEGDLDRDMRVEYIQMIRSCGEQLLTIIGDIVDVSIIEAGQFVPFYSRFECNHLLSELFNQFNILKRSSNLILILDEDPETYMNTDRSRIKQVLTNLLTNAFKYTTSGEVRFGYQRDGMHILFYVKDSGKGIPMNMKEQVFERFFRIEDQNQLTSGTGLGLTISQAIIKALGGEIWFDSILNQGTTFYVRLPLSP